MAKEKSKLEKGDKETALAAILAMVDVIRDAGMSVRIRNPGRLAGDWIVVDRERLEEAEIYTFGDVEE